MYINVATEMSSDRNGQTEMSPDRNGSDRKVLFRSAGPMFK